MIGERRSTCVHVEPHQCRCQPIHSFFPSCLQKKSPQEGQTGRKERQKPGRHVLLTFLPSERSDTQGMDTTSRTHLAGRVVEGFAELVHTTSATERLVAEFRHMSHDIKARKTPQEKCHLNTTTMLQKEEEYNHNTKKNIRTITKAMLPKHKRNIKITIETLKSHKKNTTRSQQDGHQHENTRREIPGGEHHENEARGMLSEYPRRRAQ